MGGLRTKEVKRLGGHFPKGHPMQCGLKTEQINVVDNIYVGLVGSWRQHGLKSDIPSAASNICGSPATASRCKLSGPTLGALKHFSSHLRALLRVWRKHPYWYDWTVWNVWTPKFTGVSMESMPQEMQRSSQGSYRWWKIVRLPHDAKLFRHLDHLDPAGGDPFRVRLPLSVATWFPY